MPSLPLTAGYRNDIDTAMAVPDLDIIIGSERVVGSLLPVKGRGSDAGGV